jgi:transposase
LTPEHVQILVECSRNRVWTDEMRERHSEVHRGLKQSPEQVAKRMATFRERGITISEETREKMNASAALNQLTCECGKICRPGPMARHTKASQHKVVQS